MIDRIEGRVVEIEPTHVVVETGGVGFFLSISLNTYEAVGRKENFRFYTHLHVREDMLHLFGFAEKSEREAFLRLVSITGVGPKVAQAILSALSVRTLKDAILARDWKRLTAAPGVGRRLAERMVVELKGVYEKEAGFESGEAGEEGYSGPAGAVFEAVQGLVTLGYNQAQAEKLVNRAVKSAGGEPGAEELIRIALSPGKKK